MNRHLDWLDQAQRDLDKAKIDLQHQYWEWACFTCQQAAEKAVKALLLCQGFDAWGHAITPMLRSLEEPPVPPDLIEKAQILDAYYIQTRYPNGFVEGKPADYFNQSKARGALDAAQSILKFCQDHIPGS
ncbi:MAG TPA: HEPN domain-containing protein [Anaerolineales bacterium]|jgi:HEPN domain-containing protein|nr:HEPN domain-containing protein [Anaerolineales bacterium]